MPRIPDDLLQCSIYLYASAEDAAAGQLYGGSGFIVGVPTEDEARDGLYGYAVTNAHVARQCPVIRASDRGGSTVIIPSSPDDWIYHPEFDDLAITLLAPRAGPGTTAVNCNQVLTEDRLRKLDIGVGVEAFMIGRLMRHDGGQTNQPAVRFGNVSMMPSAVEMDDGLRQFGFLVEARSLAGYSGSPVFVVDLWRGRPEILLLGVDCGHIRHRLQVVDEGGKTKDDMFVRENSGFAVVVPAWKLMELLSHPAQVQRRERLNAERARLRNAPQSSKPGP